MHISLFGTALWLWRELIGHEPEEPPAYDLDPAAVARHQAIMARQQQILYRGTDAKGFR